MKTYFRNLLLKFLRKTGLINTPQIFLGSELKLVINGRNYTGQIRNISYSANLPNDFSQSPLGPTRTIRIEATLIDIDYDIHGNIANIERVK